LPLPPIPPETTQMGWEGDRDGELLSIDIFSVPTLEQKNDCFSILNLIPDTIITYSNPVFAFIAFHLDAPCGSWIIF